MPIIPGTWEAEAGESWRLQGATIVSLHSNLGDKSEIQCQKKEKEKGKENPAVTDLNGKKIYYIIYLGQQQAQR